jgi:hypothetical protein
MKINPLNFFDRRIKELAPHFTKTAIVISEYQEDQINRWIHENCAGRYCLVKTVNWDHDRMRAKVTIGFEQPSDMTLFALGGQINQVKVPF